MKSPLRTLLYQVHVETREGELIAVGPKLIRGAAEQILFSIKEQIASGRETEWGNPHLVLASTIH